jgi:hypothetical protein
MIYLVLACFSVLLLPGQLWLALLLLVLWRVRVS